MKPENILIGCIISFLVEQKNMRLGSCTNRFNPFRLFATLYSYWPVIITVYNLPSEMCMSLKLCFYLRSYSILIVQVRI